MPISRLTDLSLTKLKPPSTGQVTHWDATLPGFGLRISQGGTRSFVVMYGERRKLKTLGRYPLLTLSMARAAAKKLLAHITLGNLSDHSTPYSEARDAFLTTQERKNRHATVRNYRRLLNHFSFGALDKISLRDISDTLDTLHDRPSEQRHAATAIKVFFSWCVQNGYVSGSPAIGLKMPSIAKSRSRILTPQELKAIWQVLEHDPFSNIIRLAILTGQRRSELAAITPDMIDQEAMTITWQPHQTKNKRLHIIPYGFFAAKYLPPGHFNGWSKSKARLDRLSGVHDYVIHDLRRSFSSIHASIGTPLHLTELLLGHRGEISGVAAIYNRYEFRTELRAAVHKYEQHIGAIVL